MGHPVHAVVKVHSKVADDVGWEDFCISKGEVQLRVVSIAVVKEATHFYNNPLHIGRI